MLLDKVEASLDKGCSVLGRPKVGGEPSAAGPTTDGDECFDTLDSQLRSQETERTNILLGGLDKDRELIRLGTRDIQASVGGCLPVGVSVGLLGQEAHTQRHI